MVKIAVLGFGTVGSGVVEVIRKNGESISKKAGEQIVVKHILDIRDFPDHPDRDLFTKDIEDILNDDEVSIVVEVMGGVEPAYTFTKRALLSGKHVVTSNKELVATHGSELLSIAEEKNINYMFEASVGGGIPIIRPLNQCLAANQITEIMGILNGTTNYILTQMIKAGQSFENALKDAQEKGYAERNPAADVEGHDACRKIAILSSLAFGHHVDSDQIHTEGITKISLEDVEYAEEMGSVIKLLGISKKVGDKVCARVSPMMIPKEHPLAGVEDVFNGILVKGDAIGDVMFYGRGAGKLPTASAVVADVIDITKHIDRNNRFIWKKSEREILMDIGESNTSYFVRVKTDDKPAVINTISKMLGKCSFISIDNPSTEDEVAFVTPEKKEKDLKNVLNSLNNLPFVNSVHSVIRVDKE
ncbi:homoserine dehydrogenase [Petroclostridium sp. X23]|uniref:homoserine dehydrogenase n=1 Tax=Petroclostridium sp. X23 TaxID=3045146 RepID=UPI0024AE35E2|nr:homoserine dehydrogenase [Petroclostridium sp. X23]WHH61422.1 homoserine dehydrogenase [Petroclostridium sp. X23]